MVSEKERERIPADVKSEVYKRAKGYCENPNCLNKTVFLSEYDGKFHLIYPPKNVPTAKSVRFLCKKCYDTMRPQKIKMSPFGIEKKRKTVRRDLTKEGKAWHYKDY